ncbi:MAG TPA: DHCW motif cupin fold protein [Candidatus Wallbacteria bacterium]|nr:DHCW motif cupin fold protein [Candidatus Wallbacteria bacterium]
MEIKDIPFEVFTPDDLVAEEHSGDTGKAYWKIFKKGNVRFRIVEYSPGYTADHWCEKGHVVYVLDGGFTTLLKDGRKHELTKGMCYIVSDNAEAHRSSTVNGVRLLIVD